MPYTSASCMRSNFGGTGLTEVHMRALIESLESRALLTAAGTLDPFFAVNGKQTLLLNPPADAEFHDVATLADGSVIAAGSADAPDGSAHLLIAKYTKFGARDQSFGVKGKFIVGGVEETSASQVIIGTNGKIIMAGGKHVFRFTAAGQPDASFGGGDGIADLPNAVNSVAVRPDGKIIAGGGNFVYRLRANGSVDPAFSYGGVFKGTKRLG